MISVPAGTGDIAVAMISADADDIRFAYRGTDIISFRREAAVYHARR